MGFFARVVHGLGFSQMNEGPPVRGCSGQKKEAKGSRAQCSEHPAQEVAHLVFGGFCTASVGVSGSAPHSLLSLLLDRVVLLKRLIFDQPMRRRLRKAPLRGEGSWRWS